MASCLKRDSTAPNYRFHDDPFLIPYNSRNKQNYILAKQNGKRAARFVLDQHPELFNKNLIEMVPLIKPFLPKMKITAKNATAKLLEQMIEACNVADAKEIYELLKKEAVSVDLKLKYLQLLCFHNSDQAEIDESFNLTLGLEKPKISPLWKVGEAADQLANEIILEHGGEEAHKARLALMLGKAKFRDYHGALQTYEDILANGGKLDTNGYNALILAKGQSPQLEWSALKEVLEEMSAEKVPPNRETLVRIMQAMNNIPSKNEAFHLALATLSEFKQLDISPPLGAYLYLLKMVQRSDQNTIIFDIIRELSEVQKTKGTLQGEIETEDCLTFFRESMANARNLNSTDLAYRINDLVTADPFSDLLRGQFDDSENYYFMFMITLMENEELDVFVEHLNYYTPNIFTPRISFYENYLKVLKTRMAPQQLPKLWTDLIASNFCASNQQASDEFKIKFAKSMLSMSTKDEELHKAFAKIGQEIFEFLAEKYERRTINRSITDPQLCNLSLEVCLEFGNIEAAMKIVKFCQDKYSVMPDNLGGDNMYRFVMAMIEENATPEAYSAVIFMNELKEVELAEEAAIQIGQKLNESLTQAQRKALNSLFASSTKWNML